MKKLTIEDMQELAKSKGGKCLSKEYVNAHTKLEWQCKEGHRWGTRPVNVKNKGKWCPVCAGNKPLTIEEMHELAESRGGKCLSDKYTNDRIKLKWQCKEGHEWWATPNNIKRDRWCPICSPGFGERICRGLLEEMFGVKFPKSKPKWLINSEGNLMELDGYNKKMNLAFEYQGEQHFEYSRFFHVDEEDFKRRCSDDTLKKELCNANGVRLIEIPYTIEKEDIFDYIKQKLIEKDVTIPEGLNEISYKLLNVYSTDSLEEMQNIAKSRGGKCLSRVYLGAFTKLKWQCREGHVWGAGPDSIKNQNTWCPKCAGKAPLDIEEMHEIAKSRGGKCLSTEFVDSQTKLKWQCKEGRVWEAKPNHVKHSGSWCPVCGHKKSGVKQRLKIEEMQEIARKKGGRCLSIEYIGAHAKLKWQCSEGHEWWAKPTNIKHLDRWCPTCARERRGKR